MGFLGKALNKTAKASDSMRRITNNANKTIQEVDEILETVENEEGDEDKKLTRIGKIISNENIGEMSDSELKELIGESEKAAEELEDELSRMEQAIEDQQELINIISNFEERLNSEEGQSYKEVENVKEEIRALNQNFTKKSADKVIGDLESAVNDLHQESQQIKQMARIIQKQEKELGGEEKMEKHLEEEVERFNKELNAIEKIESQIGTSKEKKFTKRIEQVREDVDEKMKAESRQARNELGEEKEVLGRMEKEVNNFANEVKEAFEEAKGVEKRIFQRSGMKNEENEIRKVFNELEDTKKNAEEAEQMIQSEENFLSNIMNQVKS